MDLILDLIDMRSFSNLWYWIALAVTWSSTSHWVLGVPFDMVVRSRRKGGEASAHLELLTKINVARLLYIGREAGVVLMLIVSFVLSSLLILGFVYGAEIAQAVVLILLPLSIVGLMSFATAERIERDMIAETSTAETISKHLTKHRFKVQLLGMVAISCSAFWGMFQNLSLSILH